MPVLVMNDLVLERVLAGRRNLERILDNFPDGIVAHDIRRRIVYFNRAAEEITGFSREGVLGKDCHEAFGTPFCGGRCGFQEAPPDNWRDRFYPLNIVTRDGGSRRVELTVSGMYDEEDVLPASSRCSRMSPTSPGSECSWASYVVFPVS